MGEPADSLYVAPSQDDILMSLAARLVADQAEGRRVVLVGLFDEPGLATREADAAIDAVLGGTPPTRVRLGLPLDSPDVVLLAAEALSDLRYRTRAGDLYMPLGVGGDLGRRVAHEAALHAYGSGEGRNVFLYEERPEAVVPGAVRMRLAQIGAWLPPGAAHAAEAAGLPSFLLSFHVPSSLRGEMRTWAERLRSTGEATRQWREARAWHPLKGLGPRLQPVVHVPTETQLEAVGGVVAAVMPGSTRSRPRARFGSLARNYARRLGGATHAERLWLLLPTRAGTGTAAPPHPEALPA
jgi:hypothetical protein